MSWMLSLTPTDFPGGPAAGNLPSNVGDVGSIPGWGIKIPHATTTEKDMAAHSSVPALRVLWTEEPGGLPSVGSHRVGHD